MLRVTIYATLLTMRALPLRTIYGINRTGKILGAPNKKGKTDRAIDRTYQSAIKRLPEAEKKKSDPWSMSGQLHQRQPSTSNHGYEELDACLVVRDHNRRALLLIGEKIKAAPATGGPSGGRMFMFRAWLRVSPRQQATIFAAIRRASSPDQALARERNGARVGSRLPRP